MSSITNNMYIPYVIEQTPNGERGYDLLSRLLKDRIVILTGEINDNVATSITAQLLFLQAEDANTPISMYINSPGGIVSSGLAIIDTMNIIKPDVKTICIGQAASMASVILACGKKGSRKATKHSRIMIHQASGGLHGQATDILIHAKEIERLNNEMIKIMAKATGQTESRIRKDIDRDNFMTAEEAKEYGIIDDIIE